MRYLKYIVLLGWLVAWGLPLQAAQLKDLYEAEVEVGDQSNEQRIIAMGEALGAVLLKVGGASSLLEESIMQVAMSKPERYIRQYRYRSEAIPPEEQQPGEEGQPPATSRLLLWVGFDNESIDSLLQRYGFTVWSGVRPTTLIWLAVEEGSQRVLVGANDRGLVREVLDNESQRRAIPIRLPLLDLTDQSAVRPIDVWGGFFDNIEAASERYETQALLMGKLFAVGEEWEAQWTLRYQGEQSHWIVRNPDVTTVVASGVGRSSDFLSAHFAENSYLGADQLALRIEDVHGLNDFRRVNDYLLSLQGVTAVTLRRVDAGSSSFIVQIEGGKEVVLQAIERGDTLVEVEQLLQPLMPEPMPQAEGEPLPQMVEGQEPTPTASDEEAKLMEETERLLEQPKAVPVEELVYRLLS